MNKVIMLGRLVRDPEVRTVASGKMVTSFTVAVDRFGDKGADFLPVVVWDRLAESCGNSLSKGQRCLVEGRLQKRNYEAKDGTKRYVTEILGASVEFLDGKKRDADPASQFGQDVTDDEMPV